jgi:hypothetical protein
MKSRRWHNFVATLLVVLACISLTATAVAAWSHQTLLVTDRFVAVVSDVTDDPAVLDRLGNGLSDQVVERLALEQRLANALPGPLARLAVPLTAAVNERIAAAAEKLLASEEFQSVWERALTRAHSTFLKVVRGQSEYVEEVNGKLTVDLLGLTGAVIDQLKADGVIDPQIQLPDLSDTSDHPALVARLGTALQANLPPDFGQVPIADAAAVDRLAKLLRQFDLIVGGLIVLSLVLVLLALWWADRRWRALASISLGTIVVIGLLMLVLYVVQDAVGDAIAVPEGKVILGTLVNRLLGSLMSWLAVLAFALAIIGLPAYFLSRGSDRSAPGDEPTAPSQEST